MASQFVVMDGTMFKIDIVVHLSFKDCQQHHEHKGDPGVMPETCGTIGERAQVILVWVRALGHWERLPSTETMSHKG